jgi:glycosyltransferase involved in cell wall biosynthesis
MAHKLLSLSLSLSLNKAFAQLRATAARVNGSSLGFLLSYACSYLLHYKAESNAEEKSKELIPSIKKYVLDDFGSSNHSLNQECNGSQSQVAILLCTHQGQRFLAEQLESFKKQTHSNWFLWASDDASDDETRKILSQFQDEIGCEKVSIIAGPNIGFCANFFNLTCNKEIEADFYAYSDQDDYWKSDKLERALKFLQSIPTSTPALYCTRTELVDATGKHIGFSPLFRKPADFKNALIQNVGGGNTMVFNEAARSLLIKAGTSVQVVSHDWWTYQLVSGAGGVVFYDEYPSLLYRQHENNLVGMNCTWAARFKRIKLFWEGRFREWNNINIQELKKLGDVLTPENKRTIELFEQARSMPLMSRLLALKASGIYRQTILGNLGLIAAAVFGKI